MVHIEPTDPRAAKISTGKKALLFVIWIFPYALAVTAYLVGTYYGPASSLRASIFTWPVPQDVYLWLLIFVLLSVAWLVGEFISVTNRETVVSALQMDAVFSSVTAILFTGLAGYYIGVGKLEWWFVVPWLATIVDSLTASMLSVNNAAQKPFLSKRGTS